MSNKKELRILACDPMSVYATYDGKSCNTYSIDKNHKEFSFYSKMIDILGLMKGKIKYDVVVFEETRFPHANSQRIMYGQLAILKVLLHPSKCKLVTFAPKAIKKTFTGDGDAKKEDMIAECGRRNIKVKTDHEADAVALYYHYLEDIGKIEKAYK